MRKLLSFVLMALLCLGARAQIVNRLKVDGPTFQRYAWGRMQLFNPENLDLADSLYTVGVREGSYKLKCLGLSLEMPVRYALGDYDRMDVCALEIKSIFDGNRVPRDVLPFLYATVHEYCEYLIGAGRGADAMLEARALQRRAEKDRSDLGKMYAYSVIALIQSYRNNPWLAVENYNLAVDFCTRAREEQQLPNLYLLLAIEEVKTGNFQAAQDYCAKADAYSPLYPPLRIKCLMTWCFIYQNQGDEEAFRACYSYLVADPMYQIQAEKEARTRLDVSYALSVGEFEEALQKAGQMESDRDRHEVRHGVYAARGWYRQAYDELLQLMQAKDSIYLRVQNEDVAILDTELDNATLREQAQRLRSRNQATVLVGFIIMFAVAFLSILLNQWQLRQSLEELRRRHTEVIRTRRIFQSALDAKETEIEYRLKLLQNRNTRIDTSYEDILDS